MIFTHQKSMLMTIETIHKDIEFTITKEREMHQNFSCEKFEPGNVQPFCILSSHLGQWHHCALLLFYLYCLLITKLNKSLPVTMTMCLPKSIHLISKGLCGTSVLWSRLFDYSIGVFTENKNIIINTRWCSGPYKDNATL